VAARKIKIVWFIREHQPGALTLCGTAIAVGLK
jgi:hypothetical protein